MKKAILITNIPAPYRVPVFEILGDCADYEFTVIFAAENEANRKWGDNSLKFLHVFLKGTKTLAKGDGFNYVHFNWSLWGELNRLSPDFVVLGGLNPVHLLGWFWCLVHQVPFGFLTDGWSYSEKDLGRLHRLLRKLLYPRAAAMLGPSKKSLQHYASFGVKQEHLFQTHLCANNPVFLNACKPMSARQHHLLFAGTFTDRKMPLFFAEVCIRIKASIADLNVQIIGSGELESVLLEKLKKADITVTYEGYANQQDLPDIYADARLFLFPTLFDAWGVVANEALAAGTPVITTPYSGAADEIVIHEKTGFVLEPSIADWAEHAIGLLSNLERWDQFSEQAIEVVQPYTYQHAAKGIDAAIQSALTLK